MNHFAEIAGGLALAAAAVGGALVVLPQPEPGSAPASITLELLPKPVERAEPLPVKSDAERVEDLQKRLSDIAAEQKGLVKEIEALAAREKRDGPPSKPRRVK